MAAQRIPNDSDLGLGSAGPVEDDVVSQASEDVDPYSSHGVAPEARADRVPADIRPGRSRPDETEVARRSDERTARGSAVPGIGGGEVPPEQYAETPSLHLKRPLATRPPSAEVGTVPVPRGKGEPYEE